MFSARRSPPPNARRHFSSTRRTAPVMTRRLVRTGLQLSACLIVLIVFIFLLDNRYRVLPTKIHSWSPVHHPGHVVVDITVATCSSLSVLSKCKLGGDWSRVEKDLYLNKGWVSHAYIHVMRKKEEELEDDDRVVFDVKIGRLQPTAEKDKSQEWEQRPGGLWLLRSSKRHGSDSSKAVTAIDVLFGADAVEPRPSWTVKDTPFLLNIDSGMPEPRLSIRHGSPKSPTKPKPRINKDGRFKILQVSDMHLATGLGHCRDEYPKTSHCDADTRTLDFVGAMLDLEKPDLVVLSGDQVNGETSPDSQTTTFKFAELFITRSIPYAVIFGNHDDEGSLSRSALMALTETLPFSLSEAGPATVDGVGNYVVDVLAHGTSSHSAITLYLLDTHSYSPDEAHYKGYDWLKPSQIAWFKEQSTSRRASSAQRDFAHTHFDMAFIHIPLPEYREQQHMIENAGEWREPPTAPGFNAGFADALVEAGVSAVSCGHDHVNDYCALHQHSNPDSVDAGGPPHVKENAEKGKLWMCYAGGSGYGGYAGYGGYIRRVRVWDFSIAGRIETWKRVDGVKERKDVKIVANKGVVIGKEGGG